MSVNRKHKDAPPFVGRPDGDALLSLYASNTAEQLESVTGVKKWTVFAWLRIAKCR